ncbi:SNX16 family protein [Megaselia abdita]
MSLRAIKKRESHKKHLQQIQEKERNINFSISQIPSSQSKLRKSYSLPDIRDISHLNGSSEVDLHSKSDTNLSKIKGVFQNQGHSKTNLSNAKSEVCLKTISVHSTSPVKRQQERLLSGMEGISRSDKDLAQRRLSNNSISSRLTDPEYFGRCCRPIPPDMTTRVRVPIIGYEVMEERARFTVYKLRVENPSTNDCWLVMRRYTDFVRLNQKLKQIFPTINLQLPRKKIFGDNFNSVFLDNRVQGLQIFVNTVMANEQLRACKVVREFFCLDEPPTHSESMEECRAIFEAQEETISHLRMQINSKNELILSLQQKLRNEIGEKEVLREEIRNLTTAASAGAAETANCNSKSKRDVNESTSLSKQ